MSIDKIKKNTHLTLNQKENLKEIEDIIPLTVVIKSAKYFLKNYLGLTQSLVDKLTESLVNKYIDENTSIFQSIQSCVKNITKDKYRIDRLGFNRSVIDIINQNLYNKTTSKTKISLTKLKDLINNFKILFSEINKIKRVAQNQNQQAKFSQKINRLQKNFLKDHPLSAKREDGLFLLESIENMLAFNYKSDIIKSAIIKIKKDYNLNQYLTKQISNYEEFKEDLNKIKYALYLK